MTKSTRGNCTSNPDTIAIASGYCVAEPCLIANANGNRINMAANVIMAGVLQRSRTRQTFG